MVKSGRIVGRGYHAEAGGLHGEAAALAMAGKAARGATLYVTLEPCGHQGRTAPCTEAVIAARIKRVVFGSHDPNPKVRGGGAKILAEAGIEVEQSSLADACDQLIMGWRKFITTGIPWVTLKLAASLDGRIATSSGESRWITGEASRREVHRWRSQHDGILVGAQTILDDDPDLGCRLVNGRNPVRVILDGRLRTPLEARVVQSAKSVPTWILSAEGSNRRRISSLRDLGVEVFEIKAKKSRFSLPSALRLLAKNDLSSLLVEGGASTAASFVKASQVDALRIFYAPKLLGGDGKAMIESIDLQKLHKAPAFGRPRIRFFGDDLLLATELAACRSKRAR